MPSLPIIRIILIIFIFIIIVLALQFFIGIRPPRYYDPDTPDNYNLKYENITFTTSDNLEIKAWLIPSEKSNGTVIIGHGYPSNKGNMLSVRTFLYPDYNLFFFDHRYFGESQGKITTAGIKEVEDVRAAVKFINKKYGKDKPIALFGFSLSASTMLMSETEVQAIIADSPYANLENMIKQVFRMFGPLKLPLVKATNLAVKIIFKKHPKNISPASSARRIKTPILLIHGGHDTVIPVENAYIIKENDPSIELWIVNNSSHGQAYTFNKKEYEKRVKEFLKKHMKKN